MGLIRILICHVVYCLLLNGFKCFVPYLSFLFLAKCFFISWLSYLFLLSGLYNTQIASSVNEGKHVPKGLVFALLSKRLEEGYARGESGFILDGIPRTLHQAVSFPSSFIVEFLTLWPPKRTFVFHCDCSHLFSPQETLDQIAHIDLVVNLKCSEDHLVNRSALSETPLPPQEFLGSILHSSVAIKARRESLSVYAEEVTLALLFDPCLIIFCTSS